MRTAFLLGAGASCADGAPVQARLFNYYFENFGRTVFPLREQDLNARLRELFLALFSLDTAGAEIARARFPTFEEVLGLLDLCRASGDSLLHPSGAQIDVENARRDLTHLIALALYRSLESSSARYHHLLAERLEAAGCLEGATFVSLNYDILADNALSRLGEVDYAVPFAPERGGHVPVRRERHVSLLKVHGSLNWLYCPACRLVRLTPNEKGVVRLVYSPATAACPECSTTQQAVIVPPTYFKNLTSPHLAQVWLRAEHMLAQCERLVFCGYSFPEADIFFKYLLKRATMRRPRVEVIVVNDHDGKDDGARREEYLRYARFFGGGAKFRFLRLGFAQLAEHPGVLDAPPAGSEWHPAA